MAWAAIAGAQRSCGRRRRHILGPRRQRIEEPPRANAVPNLRHAEAVSLLPQDDRSQLGQRRLRDKEQCDGRPEAPVCQERDGLSQEDDNTVAFGAALAPKVLTPFARRVLVENSVMGDLKHLFT